MPAAAGVCRAGWQRWTDWTCDRAPTRGITAKTAGEATEAARPDSEASLIVASHSPHRGAAGRAGNTATATTNSRHTTLACKKDTLILFSVKVIPSGVVQQF